MPEHKKTLSFFGLLNGSIKSCIGVHANFLFDIMFDSIVLDSCTLNFMQ